MTGVDPGASGTPSSSPAWSNRDHFSLRMPIEHAVGRMTWWRATRHWRNAMGRFGPTGKAIGPHASIT